MTVDGRAWVGLISAAAAWVAAPALAEAPSITAEDYARAERVLDYNLRGTILNARVTPHWIGREDRFWYRRDLKGGGREFRLVDASTGANTLLIDPAWTASPPLGVTRVVDGADGLAVTVSLAGGSVVCRVATHACAPAPDAAGGPQPGPEVLPSPDGRLQLFARDENLWVRDAASGAERRLTTDGVAGFSYGRLSDASLVSVPQARSGRPYPPQGVAWSPDGRFILGTRVDERAVATYPFLESAPQDGSFRPKVWNLHLPFPGDAGRYGYDNFVIDAATGARRPVTLPEGWQFANVPLAFGADGKSLFALAADYDARSGGLVSIDLETGAVRTLIRDASPTALAFNVMAYVAPDVRVLGGGKEAIWFSERDGYGHLYLYDLKSGRLKRQITRGPWVVRDIIRVDEANRQVFFTATGREGGDPYLRRVYRASLDRDEVRLLTPEPAEHEIDTPVGDGGEIGLGDNETAPVSPSGRYLVDTWSTVNTPPVSAVRSTADGKIIARLETGDASVAVAAGWRAPDRFTVKAADGKTDLWGVIYYPPGYAPGHKYPVIDAIYGGPQIINAPRTFAEAVGTPLNPVLRSSLAQLGFIVITLDGRGTPGRSKAFHNISYGVFADPELDDHVAGVRELAARLGTFDLDRVGVYGHSFGGYTSARAILSHPDFYKVAVSSAGSHNYHGFYDSLEGLIGIPDYGGGSRLRPTPQSIPLNYRGLDNGTLAANLKGHLMLVYGDMDENALPSVTVQLADALIKANKTFDLVLLPNRTHGFFRTDPYYVRRNWDYFVEHLLGATPPADYVVKPPPTPGPPQGF